MKEVNAGPVRVRGIGKIYYFSLEALVRDINDARAIASMVAVKLNRLIGIDRYRLTFIDNESIGLDYILYRFRVYTYPENKYAYSLRIVAYKNRFRMGVATINIDLTGEGDGGG